MIALFSEPIECEWHNGFKDGLSDMRPGLWVGLETIADATGAVTSRNAVVVLADGRVQTFELYMIQTKWQYDDDLKDWIDHSGPPEEIEEDQ